MGFIRLILSIFIFFILHILPLISKSSVFWHKLISFSTVAAHDILKRDAEI
jgi:hypothetical protein